MKIRKLSFTLIFCLLHLTAAALYAGDATARTANLTVEDFNINNGNPPNNVGGNFGESPANSPCEFVADQPDALHNPSGHSMRLTHPEYVNCLFFSKLGPDPVANHPLDASSYKSVSFYMKSNFVNGPRSFGMQLRDTSNNIRRVWVGEIPTNTWKKISIPFLQFKKVVYNPGPLDISRLTQFDVNYEVVQGGSGGTAFIDQIAFSRQIANLTIADFEYGNLDNLGGYINFWSNSNCYMGIGGSGFINYHDIEHIANYQILALNYKNLPIYALDTTIRMFIALIMHN